MRRFTSSLSPVRKRERLVDQRGIIGSEISPVQGALQRLI